MNFMPLTSKINGEVSTRELVDSPEQTRHDSPWQQLRSNVPTAGNITSISDREWFSRPTVCTGELIIQSGGELIIPRKVIENISSSNSLDKYNLTEANTSNNRGSLLHEAQYQANTVLIEETAQLESCDYYYAYLYN